MALVLVVGGAGYIGSHCCKALAAAGHTPVTFDNLSTGHRYAVQWGPLEEGDLLDREALDRCISKHRPQAVLHFAALTSVGDSMRDPASYYRGNVCSTLNLLAAMVHHGVRQLVFSSTCAIYGAVDGQAIGENTPLAPINPYGASKMMVERILQDHDQAYGLRFTSLRYFNACGADPGGEIGEDQDEPTRLMPRALLALSGKIDRLEVYGSDYDTPDGTCIRDYIHVTDLAAGHVQALDYLMQGGASAAFNLGIGRGFSVREVLAAVERVTGKRVPQLESERRPGDPPRLVANPARAREVLGFDPRIVELDEIVQTAWQWHRKRHDAS